MNLLKLMSQTINHPCPMPSRLSPGASVNAPFLALFSSSAFIGNKPSVYLRETPTFFTTNPRLLDAFTLSHFHFSISGFHIPAKKSY